jgi:hypothetical protein
VSFYNNDVSIGDWVFTLKGVKPSNMYTLRTNKGSFATETYGGISYQVLDAESQQMFAAIGDNTIDQFVAQHPDVKTNDAAQPQTSASPAKK